MTNLQGNWIWYELLTGDADAAADFYASVAGWHPRPAQQPEVDYRFFWSRAGEDPADGVGGFMAINDEMAQQGLKPGWLGYLAVEDVDRTVTAITEAGGSVLMPALDMEGVGRMALVADPQGAAFYVMRGASDETSHAFAKHKPKMGHCAWNELATSDPAAAWGFYGPLFGWSKQGELDMGPMGTYEFIASDALIGAIMPTTPDQPATGWTFYFRVPDITAAAEAVRQAGGSVLVEPMEIPGGDFSLVARDPDGAVFGLVGAKS